MLITIIVCFMLYLLMYHFHISLSFEVIEKVHSYSIHTNNISNFLDNFQIFCHYVVRLMIIKKLPLLQVIVILFITQKTKIYILKHLNFKVNLDTDFLLFSSYHLLNLYF